MMAEWARADFRNLSLHTLYLRLNGVELKMDFPGTSLPPYQGYGQSGGGIFDKKIYEYYKGN